MNEISKIKYHISILKETIDMDKYPIQYLILNFDWNRKDLNDLYDIFDKFDNELENHKIINGYYLENELKEKFNISYQEIKVIINCLYSNNQYIDVCYEYAKQFKVSEFHDLISDYEKK